MKNIRILFSGGGSIGHLAPSVAVWEAVRAMRPDAEALFVCSERPDDSAFLLMEKIEPRTMPMPRMGITLPWQLLMGFFLAIGILRAFRPDVIFCKGGRLNVSVTIAAKILRIPVVLHESDRVMGRANRFLSRFATLVCLGFPLQSEELATRNSPFDTAQGRQPATHIVTGNPIRQRVTHGSREQGLHLTGFSGRRPILLVIGGSQGALSINDAVAALLPQLVKVCDVAHITGKGKMPVTPEHAAGTYWASENASRDLHHLYAIADVALSRAGAGSISELAAAHIPSILVPLRGVAQDHQEANARYAAQAGGCLVLEQEELAIRLVPLLQELCGNPSQRKELQTRIMALQRADTTERIAGIVVKLAIKS